MSSRSVLFIGFYFAFFFSGAEALRWEKTIYGDVDKSQFSDSEYEDYMRQIYLKNYKEPVSSETVEGAYSTSSRR